MFTITKAELQSIMNNKGSERDTVSDIIEFFRFFVIRSAKEEKHDVIYYFVDKNHIVDEALTQLKRIYIDCYISCFLEDGFTIIVISWA